MWTADSIQNEYAKALTQSLPNQLNSVGRATGGTEANEEAIKTATVGTMGDVTEFELRNYVMYDAIYNEKFENQLEHLNPFDRMGEFEPKYK